MKPARFPEVFDVVVIGGGFAGLALAARAGKAGLITAVVDPAMGEEKTEEHRTVAISFGSMQILRDAGIWQHLKPHELCPIEKIDVLDGNSPTLLSFLGQESHDRAFGWIVFNRDLLRAAYKAVSAFKNVFCIKDRFATLHEGIDASCRAATLQSGRILSARLLIGADGRQSRLRTALDIPVREWSYKQRAVILTARHERPHDFTAVEHFWPEGPFAILPMTDASDGKYKHRSAVVFTEHGPQQRSWTRMRPEVLTLAVAARFPDRYGAVDVQGPAAAYPLGFIHAERYTAPRAALVADAAHGIHPIAGQGLNIGLRDVAALADLLDRAAADGQDPGAPPLLEAYQQQRRFDVMTMASFTDNINRLFSNARPSVRALRRAGLALIERLPAAKRFFIRRAMGDV